MGAGESKQLSSDIEHFDICDNKKVIEEFRIDFENDGLSESKSEQVNIAIMGKSGVGKSSFINSFRGLKAGQKGAADVGICKEKNAEPKQYLHPRNNNIVLWYLPEVGIPKLPREAYLQMIEFKKYDYFLIFIDCRLNIESGRLAMELSYFGKKVFFVRTKMGIDVHNNTHYNSSVCKAETVNKVRKSVATDAEIFGFKGVDVFLIDNFSPKEYDFPILQEAMIENVPQMKQDAMTFSLTNLTENLIYRKKDAIRKRIVTKSFGSLVGCAVPILSLNLSFDIEIVIQVCLFYRKQFDLDDDSLQKNAYALGMSLEQLKAKIKMKSHLLGTSVEDTRAFVWTTAVSEVADPETLHALPITGSAFSVTMSYSRTVAALRSILDVFVEDALAINKLSVERLSTKAQSLFPCFIPECFFIFI